VHKYIDLAGFSQKYGGKLMIKGIALKVLVLGGLLTVALPAVASQAGIVLMQGQESTIFTGIGSKNSVGLDLGTCKNGTCTLAAVGIGTGLFSSARGIFTISSPANLNLQLTNPQTGLWTALSKGDDITFTYKSGPSGTGATLLTGNLNLLQFQQRSPALSGGANTYITTASLTVTGGSLDITHGEGMNIKFFFTDPPKNINSLLSDPGGNIAGNFGSARLTPTPEPASILLLGSGFLLAAVVLRGRRGWQSIAL